MAELGVRHNCIQGERIKALETDNKNMTGWQKSQNGSLEKLCAKVDSLESTIDQWRGSLRSTQILAGLLGLLALVLGLLDRIP